MIRKPTVFSLREGNFAARLSGHAGSPGFSLVEMAVVLVLMSMMLTLGIAAFSVQQDHAAISATQRKQEVIKDALVAYLRTYKRLPCPEVTGLSGSSLVPPTGLENRGTPVAIPTVTTLTCTSYVGTLPWLDLGLPKDAVLDGYGNFFTYYVASAQSNSEPDWTLTASLSSGVPGFSVGSPGRFAITENAQPTTVDTLGNPLPALAAVVLISHGKNGLGAVTEKGTRITFPTDPCELENSPTTAAALVTASWNSDHIEPYQSYSSPATMLKPAVFKTLYVGSASGSCTALDDIVLAIRPNDLLTPIIKDGAMKSVQAQLNESFNKIKTALAAYAFATPNGTYGGSGSSSCTVPNSAPPYCRLLPLASSSGLVPTTSLATYGLTVTDIIDPWGNPIRYAPTSSLTSISSSNGLSNSTPSSGNAYTLTSDGPDKAQGTTDDIPIAITLIELRQAIGTANLP